MQLSLEKTSDLGRRLTISVDAKAVETVVQAKLNEYQHKKQLPGFRPGRIPRDLLKKRFGDQIQKEAVSKLIETTLEQVLEENKLEPASRPIIDKVNFQPEKELQYSVLFEVYPDIQLGDFSAIKVERYQVDISESDIDEAIEKLQSQLAHYKPVEREARMSDRVIVDYESTLEGKPYENSHSQDVPVDLGSNLFIEGFETGLVGARVGETRILDLQFPDNWRLKSLAGKDVQFKIMVKAITEKELPEVDEAFAKKIQAKTLDNAGIRETVRLNLEKRVAEAIEARLKEQLSDKLIQTYPFSLPEGLIEREMTSLHEEYHRSMADKPKEACHHPDLMGRAKRRVALGLLLRKVIEDEKLTPNPEQVRAKVSEVTKMFGNAEFVESMYYESEELLSHIRQSILIEQAFDFILSRSTVINKTVSFETLFQGEATS